LGLALAVAETALDDLERARHPLEDTRLALLAGRADRAALLVVLLARARLWHAHGERPFLKRQRLQAVLVVHKLVDIPGAQPAIERPRAAEGGDARGRLDVLVEAMQLHDGHVCRRGL